MDTPRKSKSAPEWQDAEVATGVRPCAPEGERTDPDTLYWIGLVCQTLTDAGPGGLSFVELGLRTKLGAVELERVIAIAVERDFVKQLGPSRFVARDASPR